MNEILVMCLVIFFHWMDMLFTVLYIKKLDKHFNNAWEVEVNYHRLLFKRFGLVKGAAISICISTALLSLMMLYIGTPEMNMAILGMCFMIAYVNFASWFNFEEAVEWRKNNEKNHS